MDNSTVVEITSACRRAEEHSLSTPYGFSLSCTSDGDSPYSANATASPIPLDGADSPDAVLHRAILGVLPHPSAVLHLRVGYVERFSSRALSVLPYNDVHRAFFGDEIPCVDGVDEAARELKSGRCAVLLAKNGALLVGRNPTDAVEKALALEYVAKMAAITETVHGIER